MTLLRTVTSQSAQFDPSGGIRKGMKVEAWDKKTPTYMCAATIGNLYLGCFLGFAPRKSAAIGLFECVCIYPKFSPVNKNPSGFTTVFIYRVSIVFYFKSYSKSRS